MAAPKKARPRRVAFHARGRHPGTFITDRCHYPPRHEAYWDSSLKALRHKGIAPDSKAARASHLTT